MSQDERYRGLKLAVAIGSRGDSFLGLCGAAVTFSYYLPVLCALLLF